MPRRRRSGITKPPKKKKDPPGQLPSNINDPKYRPEKRDLVTPEAQAISGISLNIGGILISLRDVMLKEARMHARLERKRTLRGAKIAKGWAKARIELEKAKKKKPMTRKTGPGIYDFD